MVKPRRGGTGGRRREPAGTAKERRTAPATWDRRKKPERRAELLRGFVDYLIEHGLADLSLTPAARALGTSPRMLLHYFGSKEALLADAVGVLQARQRDAIFGTDLSMSRFDEIFWSYWTWVTSAEFTKVYLVSHELLWRALREPHRFAGIREQLTTDWQTSFAASLAAVGLSEADSRALSTAYLAALRGLLVDLLGTGDLGRVNEAAAYLARRFRSDIEAARPPPKNCS
jgi:AcrR family transcriptional regulator